MQDEFIEQLAGALQADDGMVLVIRTTDFRATDQSGAPASLADSAFYGCSGWGASQTTWIDIAGRAARNEIPEPCDIDTLVRDGMEYTTTVAVSSRSAPLCGGTNDPIVALVLECEGSGELTIESGTFEGEDVVIGAFDLSDEEAHSRDALFLDGSTWLPVAREWRIDPRAERYDGQELRMVRKFDTEFVPRSSLPDNFFNPKSLDVSEAP